MAIFQEIEETVWMKKPMLKAICFELSHTLLIFVYDNLMKWKLWYTVFNLLEKSSFLIYAVLEH